MLVACAGLLFEETCLPEVTQVLEAVGISAQHHSETHCISIPYWKQVGGKLFHEMYEILIIFKTIDISFPRYVNREHFQLAIDELVKTIP